MGNRRRGTVLFPCGEVKHCFPIWKLMGVEAKVTRRIEASVPSADGHVPRSSSRLLLTLAPIEALNRTPETRATSGSCWTISTEGPHISARCIYVASLIEGAMGGMPNLEATRRPSRQLDDPRGNWATLASRLSFPTSRAASQAHRARTSLGIGEAPM